MRLGLVRGWRKGRAGAAALAIALVWPAMSAFAQSPAPVDLEERFSRLERLVTEQAEQIRKLSEENRRLSERLPSEPETPVPPATNLPAIVDDDDDAEQGGATTSEPTNSTVADDLTPAAVGGGRRLEAGARGVFGVDGRRRCRDRRAGPVGRGSLLHHGSL